MQNLHREQNAFCFPRLLKVDRQYQNVAVYSMFSRIEYACFPAIEPTEMPFRS